MSLLLSANIAKANAGLIGEDIIVDINFSVQGSGFVKFEKCKFTFLDTGSLKFQDCILKNCSFIGLTDLHLFNTNAGVIELISCKRNEVIHFGEQFRNIKIENSVIFHITDTSICSEYKILRTNIFSPYILGECDSLVTDDVLLESTNLRKTKWDKIISKKAVCNDTTFRSIRINPYYLAIKCSNKSSLDISGSYLIDNWSRLRKRYAGLSLFIVFLLTFLFFLPIFTHSFFLLTLSKIDSVVQVSGKVPLWKALLFGGKEGFNAILYAILTFVLLLYNIGRLYMTISIARLREEENFLKDSNFNLVSIDPEKYKTQLILDKYLSAMFWLSLGYTTLKFVDTILILVPAFN